jgi:MoxR-like ATPase
MNILSNTTGNKQPAVQPVLGAAEIQQLQHFVREISINEELVQYVASLIRASRPDTSTVSYVKQWVRWGSGPRAGQALILTAKARALLKGRFAVIMEDIHAMAAAVLRHRILMNFKAEAENILSDDVAATLLKTIHRPKGKLA